MFVRVNMTTHFSYCHAYLFLMFYMLVLHQLNILQIYQCMGCLLRIFKKEILKSRDVIKRSPRCRVCWPWTRPWVQSPSPKFDIVKFIILFLKDRWLSNTSFFFSSKPTLRYRIVYGSIVPTRKVGRGGGKSRKLPNCLSTEEIKRIDLLEIGNGPQTRLQAWMSRTKILETKKKNKQKTIPSPKFNCSEWSNVF